MVEDDTRFDDRTFKVAGSSPRAAEAPTDLLDAPLPAAADDGGATDVTAGGLASIIAESSEPAAAGALLRIS
jgi:hypothetical protein